MWDLPTQRTVVACLLSRTLTQELCVADGCRVGSLEACTARCQAAAGCDCQHFEATSGLCALMAADTPACGLATSGPGGLFLDTTPGFDSSATRLCDYPWSVPP